METFLNESIHEPGGLGHQPVYQDHHFQSAAPDDVGRLSSGETVNNGVMNGGAQHLISAEGQSLANDCFSLFSSQEASDGPSDDQLGFPWYLESSNPILSRAEDGLQGFFIAQDPTDPESLVHDPSWSPSQLHMQTVSIDTSTVSLANGDLQVLDHGITEGVRPPSTLASHDQVAKMMRQPSMSNGRGGPMRPTPDSMVDLQSQTVLPEGITVSDSETISAAFPLSPPPPTLTLKVKPQSAPAKNARDIQYHLMHELSELGITFYKQAAEIDRPNGFPATSMSGLSHCAGNVLQSSLKFLNLLESTYPLKTSPSFGRERHTMTLDEDEIMSEASLASDTPNDTKLTAEQHAHFSVTNTNGAYKDPNSSAKPLLADMTDTTEILGLLTCHIRILHLHNILYLRFSDYLTETLAQEGAQLPPIFPDMEVGGVSLDRFGKFQVKLLLQISAHVLGEIEMTLGLPDRYRISKRGDAYSRGILEGSVSLELIEVTMKERGRTEPGIEKDRIASIRENLVRLRQLLRGTINT